MPKEEAVRSASSQLNGRYYHDTATTNSDATTTTTSSSSSSSISYATASYGSTFITNLVVVQSWFNH